MEANDIEFDGGRSLRRWNRALAVLAWLGLLWAMYTIGDAFWGNDFSVGLKTKSGIKLLTSADFTVSQRYIVVLIVIPQVLCWVFCLWQIVQLSKQFSIGQILSLGMVKCLERFGYGLVAQGVAEVVQVPLLAAYLKGLRKVESVEDIWQYIIGGGVLTSLMAAVLLIVITRILRIGIRLREDAELTI